MTCSHTKKGKETVKVDDLTSVKWNCLSCHLCFAKKEDMSCLELSFYGW